MHSLLLGLSKLGIVCAFINTNLRSKSLQHCIEVSGAKAVIVGQGTLSLLTNIKFTLLYNLWFDKADDHLSQY